MMIKSNYKSYCSKCHFSIWKGEHIELKARKPVHLDCLEALKDLTPRVLNKRYQAIYGNVKKSLVIRMIENKTTLEN